MNAFAKPLQRSRLLIPLQVAWRDWLSLDAPVIGYVVKVLLACLLAMWLSLRFELDQPRTAMLTVAIVMQSRSGMVFAKSYYRLLGTVVGMLVSFLLVAWFAQERIPFLVYMACWIGFCTAGSMIYRNHQSYAFVLSGYTLCIVGLPATLDPGQTFNIGVTRISEIMVGLISATMVSDLVFPQRVWDVMLESIQRRFKDFSDLLYASASNPENASSGSQALLRFNGDIFSLETLRASAVMENDESRQHRLRLSQMNNEFMEVSTSLHAFEQLLRRQRGGDCPQVGLALQALYRQLAAALAVDGRSAQDAEEARLVAARLEFFRRGLTHALNDARVQLPSALPLQARLAFDTGAELLQRLADELQVYARTYASLAAPQLSLRGSGKGATAPRLEMHFDPLAVTLAGVRGSLVLAVMSSVWILTDWRSGIEAITLGVISSTLFSTAPAPARAIKQFFLGALIGTLLAYFCNFHWLPHAQGFLMLALAVCPGILLAAWLTTRPAWAVVGAATFVVFLLHIGFNSRLSADPVTFMNDAIADLLAVLLSGVMYGLIDLSTSRWSRLRIARALRALVVTACRDPLLLRRARLEAAARDLVQRAGSAQRIADEGDRAVIDWLLSTLEVGHAVIALREHLREVNDAALSAPLVAALDAIAALYAVPGERHLLAAIVAIDDAMAQLSEQTAQLGLAQSTRRKLLTMLHFIHSALQDEGSAFASSARREGA